MADATRAERPSAMSAGSPVRRWLPWVLLAIVVVTCLSVATFGSRSAPTAQDRVAAISRTIKCPACAGESVAESNAPASYEIRIDIAQRIQAGQTDDEIRSFYAAKYGDAILLTPSAEGVNLLVWVLPVVAIALGFGALVVAFRRWNADPVAHASEDDRVLVAQALRQEHDAQVADVDGHGEGSSR
ncbi:MAG TPA: cytochrome c-type biogenesis protein [Acidimicrobiales bacterium]